MNVAPDWFSPIRFYRTTPDASCPVNFEPVPYTSTSPNRACDAPRDV